MIDFSDTEELISKCFDEISSASRSKYDSEKADKSAALFLAAQMKVSFLIEEMELKARNAKNEISRVEGEKYLECKTSAEKKITENTLAAHISKDPDIVRVKNEHAQLEASVKKWVYVLASLKDGHIYFRNLGKSKNWQE